MSEATKDSAYPVQFVPFSSALDGTFWSEISRRKLEVVRLEEGPVPAQAWYSCDSAVGLPALANLDHTAFDMSSSLSTGANIPGSCQLRGSIWLPNSLEAMKKLDKTALLEAAGQNIWDAIESESALRDPGTLNAFIGIVYVDIKSYKFWYWFAFPAVCLPDAVVFAGPPTKLPDVMKDDLVSQLDAAYGKLKPADRAAFLVDADSSGALKILPLSKLNEVYESGRRFYVGYTDPSTSEQHPGWPLRNLLGMLSRCFRGSKERKVLPLLAYRRQAREGQLWSSRSLVFSVRFGGDALERPRFVGWERNATGQLGPRMVNLSGGMDPKKVAETAVGLNLQLMRWRLAPTLNLEVIANTRCLLLGAGTLGCNVARSLMGWGVRTITFVDAGRVSYSNPVRQSLYILSDCENGGRHKADAAADALKCVFPAMDARGVVLSIPMPGHGVPSGSGDTIRKQVEQLEQLVAEHDAIFLLLDTREARWLPTLMACARGKLVINAALGFDTFLVMRHGVGERSEVDSDKPSRCGEGPSTSGDGQFVHGGMPSTSGKNPSTSGEGPPAFGDGPSRSTKELPTSGNGHSVPIGGPSMSSGGEQLSADQLGCYFCNDVVGPTDSTRDRTLDQQCTVTRPGVSMMAGALAVELLVGLLQHPEKGRAPAGAGSWDAPCDNPLGMVPHQIRGFIGRHHYMTLACTAFSMCTACSPAVVSQYNADGWEFVAHVLRDASYLEELTGLSRLHAETDLDQVWALSDSEGD
ncbi:ubiquitin-like modifier-activating enzyme ATG7 [Ixodes scapularis]|uniref:ubiquitin-like modifier-activating enzyme ATG7 n=1 Tax=Ixodes scapularis TaxID=6945 RepID=UPI001A9FE856|nr:ubiquitin-like modifier-activating enzyme ATG7 [Ixodes scapularis]